MAEVRMGRWTYYSPLGFGTLLAAILVATYREHLPAWPAWTLWAAAIGGCVASGVFCQFLMFGAQGLFAQVLPVPGGRSIRGRGAVVGGAFVFLCAGAGLVAALLKSEGLYVAWFALAAISLAGLIGVVVTYGWCWPTAVRDFADED
jgi:hypothetical protein